MPTLSSTYTQSILEHYLGVAAQAFPTEVWLGLSTDEPSDDFADMFEVVGGGYGRIDTAGAWTTGSPDYVASNASLITFLDMPAVTVAWAFVSLSETLDEYVWKIQLTESDLVTPAPVTTIEGVGLEFPSGALVIQGTL